MHRKLVVIAAGAVSLLASPALGQMPADLPMPDLTPASAEEEAAAAAEAAAAMPSSYALEVEDLHAAYKVFVGASSMIADLRARDEVKFVLAHRADYEWMRTTIEEHALAALGPTLLASPGFGALDPRELVEWVLADKLPVRVNLQLHKYVWGADAQGV